MLLLCYDCVFF
uniref:Uncharacterized protein n=1 Tax=Anguilla anguilla TaxID=7936 RepID=A0A0E9Q7Y3_ANGAN